MPENPINNDDSISFEDAMARLEEAMANKEATFTPEGEMANEPLAGPTIWATITYEEGTSGSLRKAEGILLDQGDEVSIINPETGVVTVIGGRFTIRIDLEEVEITDEEDQEEASDE